MVATEPRRPAEVFPVASFVRDELATRGWSPTVLMNRSCLLSMSAVQDILNRKPLTMKHARGLATAFGTSPDLWLNLDHAWWSTLDATMKGGLLSQQGQRRNPGDTNGGR